MACVHFLLESIHSGNWYRGRSVGQCKRTKRSTLNLDEKKNILVCVFRNKRVGRATYLCISQRLISFFFLNNICKKRRIIGSKCNCDICANHVEYK